jgi:cytochrome c556
MEQTKHRLPAPRGWDSVAIHHILEAIMRLGTWAMAGAALLLGTAVASASGGKPVAAPAPADASGAIAGRQAAFRLSGALFGSIKGAIDRGDDVKTQAFAARAIAGWAKAIPGMFPAGSDIAPSGAAPTVWTDRAGFEAKAADYAAAAGKLADLAKAGDKAGFATQYAEVGKTCGACHSTYRKQEEHRPG